VSGDTWQATVKRVRRPFAGKKGTSTLGLEAIAVTVTNSGGDPSDLVMTSSDIIP
jgi:hypothetical protein